MITPVLKYLSENVLRVKSMEQLRDEDPNRLCSVILDEPVNIAPEQFRQHAGDIRYINPGILNLFPSKADIWKGFKKREIAKSYFEMSEQFSESLKGISKPACFEIKPIKGKITYINTFE